LGEAQQETNNRPKNKKKKQTKRQVRNSTNLFGEGLTVIPFAIKDNIAPVVNGVAKSTHTEHIKWPLQAVPSREPIRHPMR
jgi:hypothetical protein